jgi:hypothetical protein
VATPVRYLFEHSSRGQRLHEVLTGAPPAKLHHRPWARRQAGEFVREEMHHIREGKHGARSTKQAIAIGLSKLDARG